MLVNSGCVELREAQAITYDRVQFGSPLDGHVDDVESCYRW